jgi:hypothetical protein
MVDKIATRAATRGVRPGSGEASAAGQTQVTAIPLAVDDGTLGLLLLRSTDAIVAS